MKSKFHPTNLFILILLITALLGGCAGASAPNESAAYDAAPQAAPAAESEESFSRGAGEIAPYEEAPQGVERIVIKNANLSLVVDDPGAAMDSISRLADTMGGFVVNANLYQTRLESGLETPRASVTIRVPAERLDEALAEISALSDRDPLNKTIESQDVTREYTDLQSRLRNLQATEQQLISIMEDARQTEDVLAVYNQLSQVREQIEVIQGQIKYYEESAALSAISTELIADAAVQPLTVGGWQPVGVAKDAVQALINTTKFVANALIWVIIYLLPVALLLFVIFILPLRFFWRRLRNNRSRAAGAPPPPAAKPGA
ncbi:MAG TPA: DUF4349 domain-containing protein [Anaerolineales bacterium]|nr:DUF4349 domain-containing protein [Anaerolineales bacterium]